MMKSRIGWFTVSGITLLLATNLGGCPFFAAPNNNQNNDNSGNVGNDNSNDNGSDNGNDNSNDNGNDNGNGGSTLNVVKTAISVRHDAGLQCGDDVIAFGTGTLSGVSYIIPSAGDTSARTIPNDTEYDSGAFACSGDTIWLVGGVTGGAAFQVAVFDVTTASVTMSFPETDIRLPNIQDPGTPGNIRADGDYCVVRCDQNTVTDGKIIKVIDVSSGTPTLIAFDTNPASSGSQVDQVAVDAATKRVVAVVGDDVFVYDINNPTAAPAQYTVGAGFGFSDSLVQISGDYMIGGIEQSTGPEHATLINLTDGSTVEGDVPESATGVALGGAKYVYFLDATADDSNGGDQRSAIGAVPNAATTKATIDEYIDGSTTNNGIVGYGQNACVTPDGAHCFLSGSTSLGSGEFLQWSTGGAWSLPADPDASSPYGVPATDVDCSNGCVAFKSGQGTTAGTSTVLAYAILSN